MTISVQSSIVKCNEFQYLVCTAFALRNNLLQNATFSENVLTHSLSKT